VPDERTVPDKKADQDKGDGPVKDKCRNCRGDDKIDKE
jgi:hypothetical protein